MAGEWAEKTTFAKLADEGALEIGDGYRAKNEELGGDGPIFLRAGHVTDSHIDFSGVERFHAELEPRLRSKLSKPGDAVVTTKGNSTGRTTFVSSTMPPFVYSPHLSYWRSKNRGRIEGGFLRYWSKGPEFSEQLAGMKTSTDMAPYLSLLDQKRLTISLPPIGDQRAIAHILSTLDDKIELNRRISETLEAIARALFKSWFVEFDPVRTKMGAFPHPKSLSRGERDFNLPSPLGRGAGGEGNKPATRVKTTIPTNILEFARELRRQSTDAESLLWRLLRGRRINCAKFRRQHGFPPYILDFYCHELKLAIELDGGQHNEERRHRRDARRDDYLAAHGIRVLRFWNNEVLGDTEGVMEAIYAAVVDCSADVPSSPTPLLLGNPAQPPSGGLRPTKFAPGEFVPEGEGSFGLSKPLADLFPARLVDSELGEIPEGWEVQPLPRAIDVNPTRSLRKGQVAPYLDMANMPTRGHAPEEVVDREFGSGMRFINGDTLLARITPCLENGKTAFVDFLSEGQVGWGSTEYIVLRPKPPLPEEYAYCLARSSEFRDFAIQSMTGTSGRQRVPTESLDHFKLTVAPKHVAQEFARCVKPLFARSSAAVIESRTLAALRDTLLPKLITGELRVPDAERLAARYT